MDVVGLMVPEIRPAVPHSVRRALLINFFPKWSRVAQNMAACKKSASYEFRNIKNIPHMFTGRKVCMKWFMCIQVFRQQIGEIYAKILILRKIANLGKVVNFWSDSVEMSGIFEIKWRPKLSGGGVDKLKPESGKNLFPCLRFGFPGSSTCGNQFGIVLKRHLISF